MDRWFDQMRRATVGDGSWHGSPALPATGRGIDANVSLDPVDDGYVVLADLPGFDRDEIDLRFDDGTLLIAATHEVAEERNGPEGQTAMHRQRHVEERIHVPGAVSGDDMSATYRNGVLEVYLPGDDGDRTGTAIDVE